MITGDETVMGIQPSFDSNGDSRGNSTPGLTIRQYFAAMAMQGYMATAGDDTITVKQIFQISGLDLPPSDYSYPTHYLMYVAKISTLAADALIAELNKEQ